MRKKGLLAAAAIVGLTGVGAFASNTSIMDWSFRAPSLADADAISPKTAGDIVFENGTGFLGWDGGNWVNFGGGGVTANLTVNPQNSNYTIVATDDLILADGTSGTGIALTLPTSDTGNKGKVYKIKKTDTTYHAVTIYTSGSQTINGSGSGTSTTLNTKDETLTIVSDGSGWQILSREIPSTWASYTPTMDGMLDSSAACQYSRDGQDMLLRCKLSPTYISGTEARIYFPSTDISSAASPILPGIQVCGTGSQDDWQPAVESSKNYIVFVEYGTATTHTKMGGSSVIGLSQPASVNCRIPIAGWN